MSHHPDKNAKYLEISPYAIDGGYEIGKAPADVPLDDLRALGGATSPIKAMREKCIDCCCGSRSEVRKCTAVRCPLWPFRMGVNPFHGKGHGRETVVRPSVKTDAEKS